jgi:hypothetical protein
MRLSQLLLRLALAGLALAAALYAFAQAPPPGFPKSVSVPPLVMTGLGAPAGSTAVFQPKKVDVPAMRMTGLGAPAAKAAPFAPKTVNVPKLMMKGVN